MARHFQTASGAAPAAVETVDKNSGAGEQPLDLSKGSSNASNSSPEPKAVVSNNIRVPPLEAKHIFG